MPSEIEQGEGFGFPLLCCLIKAVNNLVDFKFFLKEGERMRLKKIRSSFAVPVYVLDHGAFRIGGESPRDLDPGVGIPESG